MENLSLEILAYKLTFVVLFFGFLGEGFNLLRQKALKIGKYSLILGFFFIGLAFLVRGVTYSRIPIASLFEFSVSLILLTLGVGLFGEKIFGKIRGFDFILILINLGLMLVVLSLEKIPLSLLPALQSPWFFLHIFSALLAYLSFTIAVIFAFLYLIKKEKSLFAFLIKIIFFGLFMQSLLLVTGSLWALETWGRFWAWDPKEIWALLTYLVFSTVVHFNCIGKINKNYLAMLVIIGYLVLLFTFFGVSLGLSGLHSY